MRHTALCTWTSLNAPVLLPFLAATVLAGLRSWLGA